MEYFADFETNNNPDDCHVWGYGVVNMEQIEQSFCYGTSISEFMSIVCSGIYPKCYFHNLNFDGAFIMHYLFDNGFIHTTDKKMKKKQFKAVIGEDRQIYSIKVKWGAAKSSVTTFLDSAKILISSIEELGELIGEETKGKIDYNKNRPKGYEPTFDEIDYIYRDVAIGAKAIKKAKEMGIDRMTIGSSAMESFKLSIGKKKYDYYFPVIPVEIDTFIRDAYKGGFNYLSPNFVNKEVGEGIVLDFNGIYPYHLKNRPMPVGFPKRFEHKYHKNDDYPLFFQRFTAIFRLKEGGLPFIRIANDLRFNASANIETTNGEEVTLTLAAPDFELFVENYDIDAIIYEGGYMFRAETGIFDKYVDKWEKEKELCTKNGNKVGRKLAKRMNNSLGGKFGTHRGLINRVPMRDDRKNLYYMEQTAIEQDKGYVPVAAYMNSWARFTEINTALSVKERLIYTDTDSLHLTGTEIPTHIPIDQGKAGYWKVERVFSRAKFLKRKCYIEEENGEVKVTITGMPSRIHNQVTFENFRPGVLYRGKLTSEHVPGGVVLTETPFWIKC